MPIKTVVQSSREIAWSYASSDAVALNALLCTTAGTIHAYSGNEKHGQQMMHFKGEAICHLQRELSSLDLRPFPVSTLYAVALLLWVEVLSSHFRTLGDRADMFWLSVCKVMLRACKPTFEVYIICYLVETTCEALQHLWL